MLVADTFEQLHCRLRTVNVDVPERSKGRTKDHVEIYSVVRLLGSLSFKLDDFPLAIEKRERPDFLLTLAKSRIGIEHTEAIPENAAKETVIRSQGHGPDLHFTRPASITEPRKSRSVLMAEIEADKPSPGWIGDSVERSWAEAMAHFIGKKVEVAGREGFTLFDENWLLMYDNWPGAALQHHKAVPMLLSHLHIKNPWSTFSRVFILDESVLLELCQTGCSFYAVNHCVP